MGLDKFSPFRGLFPPEKNPRFSPLFSLGADAPTGDSRLSSRRAASIDARATARVAWLATRTALLIVVAIVVELGIELGVALPTSRADETVELPARLPQRHAYQRTLYQFMATVTDADTAHGVTQTINPQAGDTPLGNAPAGNAPAGNTPAGNTPAASAPSRVLPNAGQAGNKTEGPAGDAESLYRTHLYTRMQQPLVGTKRGYPAVNAATACFTLPLIEQPDGVYYTPAWPEALVSFIQWRHPGNPFHDNRGLKLRAFMAAASNMMMFHETLERTERSQPPVLRPDQHGYNPVFWAFPYPGFRDVLPDEVRQAYEAGLRMIGERLLRWQPRGDGGGRDHILPVGLLHIARALGDREFDRRVAQHAEPLYSAPRFFHEAGYWDERGGIDTGFSGTANWFAVWTGLAADWPFVPAALAKVYRLRRHLLLPEPDGTATGPSHFNSRLGSPVNADQWHWDGIRDTGAAMLTDEAWQFALRPTDEQLRQAPADRARAFAFQLSEHGVENGRQITLQELQASRKMPMKWVPRVWMTYNFPASVNPAYEFYRPGTWQRLRTLAESDSPLLGSPYVDRSTASFTRVFGRDFVAARRPAYAAIVHTGPVGRRGAGDERPAMPGPLGLGGGQLSAFWTPRTGSVLLGLRRGTSGDRAFDLLDEWRTWPAHMVAGRLASGLVISSARCVDPRAAFPAEGEVLVEGQLAGLETVPVAGPAGQPAKTECVDRQWPEAPRYQRRVVLEAGRVRIETAVSGLPANSANISRIAGTDAAAAPVPSGAATGPDASRSSGMIDSPASVPCRELYEVLPVYLRHEDKQPKAEPTVIEFARAGGNGVESWLAAGDEPVAGVAAIRLRRFGGAVVVRFERPQRVSLSPAVWKDNWLNAGAASRNILIDLLAESAADAPAKPDPAPSARRVVYWIEPTAPQ